MNAFEKWCGSKSGKKCLDNSILKAGQEEYLKNRLWWAFYAGMFADGTKEDKSIAILKEIVERYKLRLPKHIIRQIENIIEESK